MSTWDVALVSIVLRECSEWQIMRSPRHHELLGKRRIYEKGFLNMKVATFAILVNMRRDLCFLEVDCYGIMPERPHKGSFLWWSNFDSQIVLVLGAKVLGRSSGHLEGMDCLSLLWLLINCWPMDVEYPNKAIPLLHVHLPRSNVINWTIPANKSIGVCLQPLVIFRNLTLLMNPSYVGAATGFSVNKSCGEYLFKVATGVSFGKLMSL